MQGSTNGTSFSDIGSYDYGANQTGQRFYRDVTVAAGDYKAIRILIKAGDYTSNGSNGYGGPGIYAIEPVGSGSILFEEVNWANQSNFTTVASNGGSFNWNSTRYTDGYLMDDEGARTGRNSGNWIAGEYVQVDLGAKRKINKSVTVWDAGYIASSYDISYSNDGSTFTLVTNKSAATAYPGATQYTFDIAEARYWRITMCVGGGGYCLLNQAMFYGLQ